jgi:VWFA-related protein
VETVEVDVRVTDRDGKAIGDLTPADFELREDGKRQLITGATFVRLAGSRTEAIAAAGDDSLLSLAGRAYVLVLDDLHVDARSSARVTQLAKQFIDRNVTPADRVAVRMTGGGSAVASFTGDKAALATAVARFAGRKLPPASLEESERRGRARELATWTTTSDPFERERGMNARAAMASLREAALSLHELRGRRKAILFFSEGIDYDVGDAIGRPDKGSEADSILEGMRQAVAMANQTNASFYTIDPRGSAQNVEEMATVSDIDRDASSERRRELLMSQASLRELADVTGGLVAVNMNQLGSFFERIVSENDAYYMLSYSPAAQGRRPGFHKIEVRVTRRGLRVRSRPGYTSLPAAPPAATATEVAAVAPRGAPAPVPVPPAPLRGPEDDPIPEPTLPDVMARVAAYVGEYQDTLAGIVGEEQYWQQVTNNTPLLRGQMPAALPQRDLRSDILLVRPQGEDAWIQFRDVFEVDGRAIRDRDERLYKLFIEPTPASRRQADVIQEEGARYNIGPLTRTINVPIMALSFLAEANQPSFRFRRVRAGDLRPFATLAAAPEIWVIEYRETATPTLIRGASNRDIPSRGKVWIEARRGRILRTELVTEDTMVKAEIDVSYGTAPGLEALVPVEMREQYTMPRSSQRIEGRATYSRFRRFTVTTSERPKPQ